MRSIETAIRQLQQRLGRQPNESEIAKELQVPLLEYQQMLQEARGAQLIYYEDFHSDDEQDFLDKFTFDDDADPLALLQDERFKSELARAISNLPEREAMVMGMIYEQDMNLREIGEVLGVSESRISQLHSQAVARLRSILKGH
jgi:RNA polymerase sigma factor for flagellar operon FliA